MADATTTKTDGSAVNMVTGIRDAMREEMRRNPLVVLLGEDVGRKGGVFKASAGLLDEFGPDRIVDTPISEATLAGAAIGAAMMGLRPIVEFQFADYMHLAYDQIVNQAATIRWRSVGSWGVPVVFRAPCGAGVHGGVYHSQSVEALYAHIPGLKIAMPATASDANGLLRAAIRDDDPVLFFEHKRLYRQSPERIPPDHVIPLGSARIDREGSTVTVLTYAIGVHLARAAAETLSDRGIELEIVDLRSLAPLDYEAIARSVRKTGRALIVHEANRTMGIGAEVAAFISSELFMDLDAPVLRVGANDCHLPYNQPEEAAIIPNVDAVVTAADQLARF